jgi:hypothetical protein
MARKQAHHLKSGVADCGSLLGVARRFGRRTPPRSERLQELAGVLCQEAAKAGAGKSVAILREIELMDAIVKTGRNRTGNRLLHWINGSPSPDLSPGSRCGPFGTDLCRLLPIGTALESPENQGRSRRRSRFDLTLHLLPPIF